MTKKEKMMAELGGNMAESSAPAAARSASATPAPAAAPPVRPAKMLGVERQKDVAQIALDRLMPDPDQPRKEFDDKELDRLAGSLKDRGQLQPIRVRWVQEAGMYKIIMGERRFRAATRAGLPSLSCVIHEGELTASELLVIQMVENIHRDDLKPVEQARAIAQLRADFQWSQSRVATELGVSQATVAKSLSLLKLTPEVQSKVDGGVISAKAAQEIAKADTPEAQVEAAAQVEAGGLNANEASRVRKSASPRKPKAGGEATRKGRGGKPKVKKMTSLLHNQDGFKIELRRSRGFEIPEALAAAEGLVFRLKSELSAVA